MRRPTNKSKSFANREMHRFIPAWTAAVTDPLRIGEIDVNHQARQFGKQPSDVRGPTSQGLQSRHTTTTAIAKGEIISWSIGLSAENTA
jgi:hypothetical protein